MRFVPVDPSELKKFYKPTKNLKFLESFRDSGEAIARVEDFTQKNAYVCATSLRHAIKHFKMAGLDCFVRNGVVYLVNNLEQ